MKHQIATAPVLTHYDPKLPIILDTDASAYGVGAVISHKLYNGEERPIAFSSRTLSNSERNYAQVEKEALGIIHGVKKFHQYLFGKKFKIRTDHKPLTTILGPKVGIPTLAAERLQRWALFLSAHNYEVEFRPTEKHANADCLSRLPLKANYSENSEKTQSVNVMQIESMPVTAEQLKHATQTDPMLSRVLEYTLKGWPEQAPPEFRAFHVRRNEITVEDGCLLWGIRVIVPAKLRGLVLEELHATHPGIVRMKSLARIHVWWPRLDEDVAAMVRSCNACQAVRNRPSAAPLHPWSWPEMPWQRIHVDFAGPFMDHMFLIVVDSCSKWLEVVMMKSTTANRTIEELRDIFARNGLPQQLVSDNGPQFTSEEFTRFMKANGIRHIRTAVKHPASNGEAERFVQTFKRAFKAGKEDPGNLRQKLAQFLFTYRTTPNTVTTRTPAELFLKRQLRTRLELLHPNLSAKIATKQAISKEKHDSRSKAREFEVGDTVLVENFRGEPKWLSATVVERAGPISYRT